MRPFARCLTQRRALLLTWFTAAAPGTAATLGAQPHLPHADHFTVDDGLSQNLLTAVVQDAAGFIWLGGDRGLQRFDGYSFVRYSSLDPGAPEELSGLIDGLRLDPRGTLWVQAAGALFRRDAGSLRFVLVAPHGTPLRPGDAWAPDSEGRLWLIDGDTLRDIESGGGAPRLRAVAADSSLATFGVLATSRAGAVWLAGGGRPMGRVVRVDPSTGGLRRYALASIVTPRAMLEDRAGAIWVAGEAGVEVLEPGRDRFRSVEAFRSQTVRTLALGDSDAVLVPTDGALSRVDALGRVIERWDSPEIFGTGLLAQDIAVDREGGIWLATLASGALRLDPRTPAFVWQSHRSSPSLALASDFVTALAEPDDGSLWIGTLRGGVSRVSADGRRVETFRHEEGVSTSLLSDEVWGLEEDRAGRLWVATNDGLCMFRGGRFSCFPLAHGAFGIARDQDGWFWLVSESDVVSFDPASGATGPPVPASAKLVSVYADPDSGSLWIGGGALFRARVARGRVIGALERVEAVASETARIYDIRRDAHGVLWLASHNGLQRWDPARRGFAPIDVPELRNTTVFSVQDDGAGRLWLGTSQGLVHYSPATGEARRYRRQDGVLSGEFNRRAALRLRDGEMVFGGVEGLTRFRPEAATGGPDAPPIVFTRLRTVAQQAITDVPIAAASPLRLAPGDRAFTIDFAALTFAAGPAPRYRYRLEGLSDVWIESSDHIVTYSTPSPGTYTFQVQVAGGADGGWSTPGGAIRLQVVPPVWRTAWFRGLILLLFAVLLWGAHRVRLRQAVATERLRLRISRDLHDEIGAGLSSIALLSDSRDRGGSAAGPERVQLQRIGQSAREMVDDLRDIVWAIDPDADRLDDVVTRMKDVATGLLRDIRVTFDAPAVGALPEHVGMADRRDLLLLYKELLHNVVRHAQATEVHIAVAPRGRGIEVTVSDNGVGFSPNGSRRGTGLKSVRERAARLGGNLELTSQPGGGTTARVTVKTT